MSKATKGLLKIAIPGAIAVFLVRRFVPREALAHIRLTVGMNLAIMLWLVFSLYWGIAAKDQAPTKTSESRGSRLLHVILVNGALILLILPVPGLTRRFLPASHLLEAGGLVIEAAFILLAVWARRHLGSNWSGEVRIANDHQLVRSGPYRHIRHPIYTAVLGMYVGTALVSGEIHAPIALFIVTVAYWRKIRLEESVLRKAFGQDHEAYRQSTWALIPGVY